MREYFTAFFTYFGCVTQQHGDILEVRLTSELSEYFRKPKLHLVFHPDHLEQGTELVTHGSYLSGRLYDLLKHRGQYVSVLLPKTNPPVPALEMTGRHCVCVTERSREVRKTEVYIIFRITYYSDEKREEIVTAGVDIEGRISLFSGFPYTAALLGEAVPHRYPFSQKHAKTLYDRCVVEVQRHAEQQAAHYQETLARHFHENIIRLEAYYHQMIEEISDIDPHRDLHIQQLQEEYDIKVTDEYHKCRMQVSVTPLSFCTITMPFQRTRSVFRRILDRRTHGAARGIKGGEAKEALAQVTVEAYQNLFSGKNILPRCESCGQEMSQVGICETGLHPACGTCLVACHECGKWVCKECGVTICFECGEWVCQHCSQVCHLCGERHCTRHLLGCLVCREHFCRQCAIVCESCGKPVARNHVTRCEISHKLNCPACTIECSCCRKQVTQSLISTCAYCGQQACSECTFRCGVCGDEFCVHHIAECDVTQAMVCPKHLGICKQCGKHVSTAVLHTCDTCGKSVCTECSQQCQQCGTFFCRQHADEIIPCSECGTLYCVLCYSGQGPCGRCQEEDA